MNASLSSRWQDLSSLYEEAVALHGEQRADFLKRIADRDGALIAPLKRLLAASERMEAQGFLKALPAVELDDDDDSTTQPGEGWSAGTRIGPYALLRLLGSGGMAQVWLAERADGSFHRQVALKLLFQPWRGAESGFASRFARERDILAALDHPHIAALYEAGVTSEGQPWLALQYVQGESITDYCDRRHLDVRARVQLFRQVLEAVRYAHANLVIHRDLKPDNVLVTSQGEVRLLDFGIAKLMEPEGGAAPDTELTRQAGRPLTPRYASPEQLRGQPLTTACDVYSLGVVLYELLCGESPYETKTDTAAQLEQAILEREPRAPSRRVGDEHHADARGTSVKLLRRLLSPELDAVVLRALGKHPLARYASVEALQADLERWLRGEPVQVRAPGAAYRLLKFARRHRVAVGLGSLAVASLVAVATVAVLLGVQARQDAIRAEAARDFVLDLFRTANPAEAKGVDPTAREMLERGVRKADQSLAQQPELLAEVLAGLGDVQATRGELAMADATFRRVGEIYRKLGRTDKLAWAQANHAENAWQMGQRDRAIALLDEAEKNARGHPKDHALHAKVSEVRGWFARVIDRDLPRAEAAMQEALRHSIVAHGRQDVRTVQILRGLALTESELHRHQQARQHIEEAASLAARLPGFESADLSNIEYQQAQIRHAQGHLAVVVADLEGALHRCGERLGKHAEICASMRGLQAVTLLRLGEAGRALQLVPDLLQGPETESSSLRQASNLVIACRVLAANGQLGPQHDLRRRLAQLAQESDIGNRVRSLATAVRWSLAEVALLEGEAAQAAAMAARTIEGADPVRDRIDVARAQLLLGVALQAQGRHAQALAVLDKSWRAYASDLGPHHALTLLYGINRAQSLEALGDRAGALAIIDDALPELRRQLGSEARVMQRVVRLRTELAAPRHGESPRADPAFFFI